MLFVIGCGGGGGNDVTADGLQRQVADLEAKLEDVRSKLNEADSEVMTLTSAVDDLTSALAQFGYMDWQSAVIRCSGKYTGIRCRHYRLDRETRWTGG